MSSPKISIVIPTLEEEKSIERTLKQFSNDLSCRFSLEIIVSDGGSGDKTLFIARSQHAKIVSHTSHARQNISIGRNLGAQAAQGEILIFLNADVVIEDPEKFMTVMSKTMEDHRIVAATCNVNIYPEDATISDWIFHNCFNGYFWLLNLLGMGMGRGECHVIRKTTFDTLGGYNPTLAAGEDYELFLRLHRKGKIKFVRELTVFESPRRFRKYGYLWITALWFLNGLCVLFFRRSLVDEWRPIR